MGGEKLWDPNTRQLSGIFLQLKREIPEHRSEHPASACDLSPFTGSEHHYPLLLPRLYSKSNNHWKAPGAGRGVSLLKHHVH